MSFFLKIFVCSLFLVTYVLADDSSIFGLAWNMSPAQIKAMGIKIEKKEAYLNLSVYTTDSLPKNIHLAESYGLLFEDDSKLIRIIMYSKTIENDVSGTKGKEMFDNLLSSLKKKYKVKKTYCYVGRKLYDEFDEFYQCLNYDGCGSWISFLYDDTKNIIVELKGLRRGTGYLIMSIESIPFFEEAIERKEKRQQLLDEEAF